MSSFDAPSQPEQSRGSQHDAISTSADAHEIDPKPDAHAVHADPDTPATPEQKPLPQALKRKALGDKSPAEWAYERLVLYIKNFEEQLDSAQEVAMGFTGSNSGVMRIEGMGFFAPDILTFYGSEADGTRTQLVQHVSQLNVMLRALAKPEAQPEAQRIGFRLVADLEQSDPQG
ncbi:hypothetical protein AQS8620_00595 [Aquimixticola soesokkakensis]|uniref:Uncharacterized protein n=1 Tax=Aquimixticola soesokkakensis TaxID=1519096 RepID=A0A1Y5RS18_9RHOB|nr:hypothetical protein [Aquimixticola soesokkakensis]SLN21229.1 hypothetical protein AQS8620_00595 [Aquimixticola soesokkakensis]